MEHIKKYEGFLDLFKSGINMISERVSNFLKDKKEIKITGLSKTALKGRRWSWVEEIEGLGQFDFSLILTEELDDSFNFNLECVSKVGYKWGKSVSSGRWAFGKLSNFDQKLFDLLTKMIRDVKVLASCEKENERFLEDFPLPDVEDYLIDLKDLVNGEIQINFEKAGRSGKELVRQIPSYIVNIRTNPGQMEDIQKELEIIESNIKNIGLEVKNTYSSSLRTEINFRFELVRKS